MKTLVFSFILISLATHVFSQKNTAILMSLKGEGTVQRGNEHKPLGMSMLFHSGDNIKVSKGIATILIANGNEIKIAENKNYLVPILKRDEMLVELDPSIFQDYGVQAQSNSSITLRGDSAELILYPISSQIINKNNARIYWKVIGDVKVKPIIAFFEFPSMEMVYSSKELTDNEILLKNIPLKEGVDYTWTLKIEETGSEQIGIITALSENQKKLIPEFSLETSLDYLKAFNYFSKNEYYFDAFNLVNEACKKFPETDLFLYLKKRMIAE